VVAAIAALLAAGFVIAAPATASDATDPAPAGASSLAEPVSAPSTAADAADADTATLGTYGGDPVAEAALVADEDRRLIDVNLVSKGILVPELDVTHPFRVTGTAVSTLVLTPRDSAYSLDELAALAPTSVVKDGDGVYDLNESIALLKGATLDIHSRGKLTLRLASQPAGFVSIVSLGGTLVIRGTAANPAQVTSWNAIDGTPDTSTADGRAYIRAMGGQVSLTDASFADLGFWSGNTGGIALTGLVQTFGLGVGTGAAGAVASGAGDAAQGADGSSAAADDPKAQPIVTTTDDGIIEDQVGSSLVPEGVTAYLANLTVTGNAFGVFAANTSSLELHDSVITGSLVDGVVFHRQVEHSSVENTASNDNAGDGFRISRGSDAIILQDVTATGNGRNGITINADPLATGPSAVGLSTKVYGDHTVRDAVLTGNAASGITVIGGDGITLSRNRIESSPFGIVVQDSTKDLRIEDSTFEHIDKQAIALRDGIVGTVTQNVIRGGAIGIYLRESAAHVEHNTISGVHGHGVSVVGQSDGTIIEANEISGSGTSPIDIARSEGATVSRSNVATDWAYQSFTAVVVDNVKRPLTLMWAMLAVLLLFTAISGFRQRRRGFGSPYRDRTPLHLYGRGLVDPATVPGAESPLHVMSRVETVPAALPKRKPERRDQTVGV
jgi:hypothetical protein